MRPGAWQPLVWVLQMQHQHGHHEACFPAAGPGQSPDAPAASDAMQVASPTGFSGVATGMAVPPGSTISTGGDRHCTW